MTKWDICWFFCNLHQFTRKLAYVWLGISSPIMGAITCL
jgi:hypothetical protein